MACGNGSDRTQHPVELFGEDWQEWGVTTESKSEQIEVSMALSSDQRNEE